MSITKRIEVPSHVEITVRRPSGLIEAVILPGRTAVNAREIEQIKIQTAKAGRGEVLSVVNARKTVEHTITDADLAMENTARIERTMRYGE